MGPPPFGDGNGRAKDQHRPDWPASMGPPPFGDGNEAGPRRPSWPDLASMGPPPFGDGNLATTLARLAMSASVPKLQWGHRLSAMETAASKMRRAQMAVTASMGPPPFGDGNLINRCALRSPSGCFNGATAFRRWKPTSFWTGEVTKGPDSDMLQWGHRLSAMETSFNPTTRNDAVWLQWGHRLSAMETSFNPTTRNDAVWLQWGHRLSAMETSFNPTTRNDAVWLQWGHRLSAMETWLTSPTGTG